MRIIVTIYILVLFSANLWSQTDSVPKIDTTKYVHFFKVEKLEDVENLDFKQKDTIPKDFKVKRPKRRVYYGYKSKRAFLKSGSGPKETIEVFHYLKKWQDPDAYVPNIYWFDPVKMKIIESRKYDPLTSKLLHGPYKKMVGGEIVEQGIYYLGTKHGRWTSWNNMKGYDFRIGDKDKRKKDEEGNYIIIPGSDTVIEYQLVESKEKFNRGWPKSCEFNFYDYAKTKLKEVIPHDEQGKESGEYYSYFEDGHIHLHGQMYNGVRVGEWVEYRVINKKTRRLQEFSYPEIPQEKNPKSELMKLWDEKGELIYDKKDKIDKRPKEVETIPK